MHAQHASSAEKAASLLEVRLKEAQATAVDLKSQLHQAKAESKSVQETSIISEKTNSSTLSELENVVKDLQQQNDELSRRSIDILLRYQQANLVSCFQIVFDLCFGNRNIHTDRYREGFCRLYYEPNAGNPGTGYGRQGKRDSEGEFPLTTSFSSDFTHFVTA